MGSGKVWYAHTSWVEGAEKFAKDLCKISGVKRVIPGELNRRASRQRNKYIKFLGQESSREIKIIFGANDGHQEIIVTPENGVSFEELTIRLWREYGFRIQNLKDVFNMVEGIREVNLLKDDKIDDKVHESSILADKGKIRIVLIDNDGHQGFNIIPAPRIKTADLARRFKRMLGVKLVFKENKKGGQIVKANKYPPKILESSLGKDEDVQEDERSRVIYVSPAVKEAYDMFCDRAVEREQETDERILFVWGPTTILAEYYAGDKRKAADFFTRLKRHDLIFGLGEKKGRIKKYGIREDVDVKIRPSKIGDQGAWTGYLSPDQKRIFQELQRILLAPETFDIAQIRKQLFQFFAHCTDEHIKYVDIFINRLKVLETLRNGYRKFSDIQEGGDRES